MAAPGDEGSTLVLNLYGDDWVATVMDGGPQYMFSNVEAAETFARAVATGDPASILETLQPDMITTIFPVGQDDTPEEIYQTMFDVCSDLEVDDTIFAAATGGQLSEQLEAVGEFLIEVMGFAAARKKHMVTQEERRKLLASWLPTYVPLTTGISKNTKMPVKKVSSATKTPVFGAVPPDFSLSWTNWSKDIMTNVYWECDLSAVTGTVISNPPDQLPDGYQASLSWYQLISGLASGNNQGWVIYAAPNGQEFGVRITVPVQVFGIGKAPYWEVSVDGGSTWFNKSHSDPYTFPESMGYNVTVNANAGHSNLFLSITINALAGKGKKAKRLYNLAEIEKLKALFKERASKAAADLKI